MLFCVGMHFKGLRAYLLDSHVWMNTQMHVFDVDESNVLQWFSTSVFPPSLSGDHLNTVPELEVITIAFSIYHLC